MGGSSSLPRLLIERLSKPIVAGLSRLYRRFGLSALVRKRRSDRGRRRALRFCFVPRCEFGIILRDSLVDILRAPHSIPGLEANTL